MKKNLTLRELQMAELEILLEFQRVCKQYNLKFYLCGGTMLGAIRHKGFIPWDDDIDVMMLRPDYEQLMTIVKEKNPFQKHLKLCSDELGNFDRPFAKLFNLNSYYFQPFEDEKENNHIWVDIFPVDGLPSDMNEVKKIYQKAKLFRTPLLMCKAKWGTGTTRIKKYFKYIFVPIVKLVGIDFWCAKVNSIAKKYKVEESDYVGIITWGMYGAGERCLKTDFMKSVEVGFEGHTFEAMSCWHEYLTGIYGDYMKLPPEEKRISHMIDAWIDDGEFDEGKKRKTFY